MCVFLFNLAHYSFSLIFVPMFENEIKEYENVRLEYQQKVADKMGEKQWMEDKSEYISALELIRTEGSDEFLIAFFFKTAITRMKSELAQKRKNTLPTVFF